MFAFVFVFVLAFVHVFGINQPPLAQLRLLPARPSARTRPPAPALWSHTETCAQVFGEKEEMCLLFGIWGKLNNGGDCNEDNVDNLCTLFP